MTARIASYVCAALLLAVAGCKSSQPSQPADTSMPAGSSASDPGAMSQSGNSSQVSPADADGIRAAIENRLQGNHSLNMDAMQMVVDSIAVQGNQAQAHASFRMKNSGSTGMTMQYFLQRSGSGWVVTSAQPADGNTTLPPSTSAPSGNSGQASQGALPDVNAFLKDHPASKSN